MDSRKTKTKLKNISWKLIEFKIFKEIRLNFNLKLCVCGRQADRKQFITRRSSDALPVYYFPFYLYFKVNACSSFIFCGSSKCVNRKQK